MLIAGIISILAAVLLNPVIPIIKKMWTPTFVLVTVGIGLVLLSFFYWVIDVKNCRKWAFPFQFIGLNSITIYLGQKIIHFGVIRDFFFAGIASKFSQDTGDLILSCAYVLVCWFFLWFFYKKKIFLKV
ncbi:MAG: hypothetical protein GX432_10740 [Candidatus Atribacteria bacterium]|nr:hypothetical protein [Candidatus Atribacteria bacterium]